MKIQQALGFSGVILAVMLLASCASTEDTVEQPAAANDKPADVTTVSPVETTTVTTTPQESVQPAAVDNMPTVFYFDYDQSLVKPEVQEALDIVATLLKTSGASVRLEGHADEMGTREYNIALSERRAEAVRNYLVVQGVEKEKMEVIAYGEEKPASDDPQKHRRVALVRS